MSTYIALLRGINVSGRNRIPMTGLRSLCTNLGWENYGWMMRCGSIFARVWRVETDTGAVGQGVWFARDDAQLAYRAATG